MTRDTRKTALACTALALSVLGLAACGSSGKTTPPASATPAAVQQPPPPPPPPPAQPAAEADWEQNSPGYQSWLDVGSDMQQLNQDLNAGDIQDITGTGGIGFHLAEAASAALQNPSPVHPREFKQAMANFGFMGVSLTNDNMTDADSFAKKALGDLQAWATAAQPGATGSGGCGGWNLPQSNNC